MKAGWDRKEAPLTEWAAAVRYWAERKYALHWPLNEQDQRIGDDRGA